MKIRDVERINDLLKALRHLQELEARISRAEDDDFELYIERGGDGSIKLSLEGADSTHYQGHAVAIAFLGRLKALALEELASQRSAVERDLAAMGVDTSE